MNLAALTDAELQALQSGNIGGLSDAALTALQASTVPAAAPAGAPGAGGGPPPLTFGQVALHPEQYDPQSSQYKQLYNPASGMSWMQKYIAGEQQLGSRVMAAGQQLYARAFHPEQLPALQQQEAERRQLDAPLSSTLAAKAGGTVPLMLAAAIPGVNTAVGSAAFGGAVGAFTPTAPGESALLNTGLGAAGGYAGWKVGNTIGNWAQARAAEPVMGFTPGGGNRVAAASLGSDAAKLDQPTIGAFQDRTSALLKEVHTPSTSAAVEQPTWDVLDTASARLRDTSRQSFETLPAIRDLRDAATSTQSLPADKLGQLSHELGEEYASNIYGEGGDKPLGFALKTAKEHIDSLIGSTIQNPEVAAEYAKWRPQYRNYLMLTHSTGILNSSAGEVNMTAMGKYLQGEDRFGYTGGHTQSPLYDYARWGQATGEGKGAPAFNPLKLGLPTLGYWAVNNPISRAAGGVTSRMIAPLAPGLAPAGTAIGAQEKLARGLPGLQRWAVGEPVPYIEK